MVKTKDIILIRKVRGTKYGGYLSLPSFLAGKEVEIRFKKKLTEEDKLEIKRNELNRQLRELRQKRIKKVQKR